MDFLKAIFDEAQNGTLTYDAFKSACDSKKFKLADLSKGEYVSKRKYDDDILSKDNTIAGLNDAISSRDGDLNKLRDQLSTAGSDSQKLQDALTTIETMKSDNEQRAKDFQARLDAQAYDFAVKDFANTLEFTSQAAKRDFISSMISEKLKLENDAIVGSDEFVKRYTDSNSDAFITKTEPQHQQQQNYPQFVSTTQGNSGDDTVHFNFGFSGVRPQQK